MMSTERQQRGRSQPPTSEEQRRRELAKIHIGAKDLGLGEDAYRALLEGVAGVSSAAALDAAGRRAVLATLRKLGWQPRVKGSPSPNPYVPSPGEAPAMPQARKILALWGALERAGKLRNGSPQALRRFVTRTTGVEALEWLTARQANTVIEALKSWLARSPRVER